MLQEYFRGGWEVWRSWFGIPFAFPSARFGLCRFFELLSILLPFSGSQKLHGMGPKTTKEIVYGRGWNDALRRLLWPLWMRIPAFPLLQTSSIPPSHSNHSPTNTPQEIPLSDYLCGISIKPFHFQARPSSTLMAYLRATTPHLREANENNEPNNSQGQLLHLVGWCGEGNGGILVGLTHLACGS